MSVFPRLGAQSVLYLGGRETARAAPPFPGRQIAPQHFFERLDLGPKALAQPPIQRGIERAEFAAAAKAIAPYPGLAQQHNRTPGVALAEPSLKPPGPLGEQRDARAVRHAIDTLTEQR